jgi:hypothetical protein
VKHRTLGIIFIAATIAAHAQQAQQTQPVQPDDAQAQQYAAPNQQQIPGAQQDGAEPSQQQPGPFDRRANAPVNWNHNHEVYPNTVQQVDNGDPAIGKRNCDSAPRASAVESATHAVNPNDTNYGGILSQWHMQLVHDLLMSVEFWGLMCALGAIIGLLLYVHWLLRQRDQRLRVTVDIALQLTNSRNFARYHNLRVIKIHNELVERLNDQYERELRENGDAPREINGATLTASSSLRSGGSGEDSTPQEQPEVADIEQSHETSNIPSVAAASEFGIESGTGLRHLRLRNQGQEAISSEVCTAKSDVETALARANAAAAGGQPTAGAESIGDESLEVKNRRLEAQVEALQQHKVALRNQINQLRQASAVGGTDNSGEPK